MRFPVVPCMPIRLTPKTVLFLTTMTSRRPSRTCRGERLRRPPARHARRPCQGEWSWPRPSRSAWQARPLRGRAAQALAPTGAQQSVPLPSRRSVDGLGSKPAKRRREGLRPDVSQPDLRTNAAYSQATHFRRSNSYVRADPLERGSLSVRTPTVLAYKRLWSGWLRVRIPPRRFRFSRRVVQW